MNLWVDGPAICWKFAHLIKDKDVVGPFLRHLIRTLKLLSLDRMAVFWDAKRSPRRMKIWPDYKKNRSERKLKDPAFIEAVHSQMDLMRWRVFQALGIPQVWIDGHEADDLIYAACQVFSEEATLILTTDQDFIQLVGPLVSVILDLSSGPKTINTRTLRAATRTRSAAQFLFLRMLTGDSSDHIPGIGGIGKTDKTGKVWPILKKCRDLDDLFSRREELRQDPDFKLVFQPQAIENLMRNQELMDLSLGEGSDPDVQSQVMTAILEGVGEPSVTSVMKSLSDNPVLASETVNALPYFDRVVQRMRGTD